VLDLGDTYTTSIRVYDAPPDAGGVLINAGTVTLTITLPDGTVTTPTPVNSSTGRYKYDLITTQEGLHSIRWQTLNPATAQPDVAIVRAAAPLFLMSLADAKRALNKSPSITVDDEEIRDLMEATTLVVEEHLNEVVPPRVVTQRIDAYGQDRLLLKAPVISLTSITRVAPSAGTYPVGSLVVNKPFGFVDSYGQPFFGALDVVYRAGYVLPPANYVEAAKVTLKHLWQEQQQAGVGPSSPFTDQEFAVPSGSFFALPPRAIELLGGRGPGFA
jgi:hypothetical protein